MTRVHVVSLPHTLLTTDYDWCAYTAKVRRFLTMLDMAGDTAILYGPDVYDALPASVEAVPVVTVADRIAWFGDTEWDQRTVFNRWDPADVAWQTMNARAAEQIRARWQPGDVVGIIGGQCQASIVTALADLGPLVVEWGIGYVGVLDNAHHVFESHAWAHCVAGMRHRDEYAAYDDVIPNCYSVDEFDFREQHDGYLLFVGRPTARKGLAIVEEIAKRTDMPVIRAGQPGVDVPGTKYVGLVTGAAKRELFAGAAALLAPTTYLGPFEGVSVEAMLSGVPVISTDWGAFTENITNGITGRRCHTLREYLDAVEELAAFGPAERQHIRMHARGRWTLDVGARRYHDYLNRVSNLYGEGWYTL